ncbi:hypothetical protein FIBSPDRAFT_817042 [Athelia psychrophila]|uniref:Carboxymuconolactone decarboxylase-like domain-containing protein n=1 Tax=Athelia psychrophila TaxID=1759441 RepID=A0A166RTX4_9AGAM|nr:hypothetical protein FIBSPDRAFT_817042 [Fibularhizoctonia sp. CBS 109695]
MTTIATPAFLSRIQALYPTQPSALRNPWFIAAAVAFSASNIPEAVPLVYKHAVQDIDVEDRLLVVRKIKDALFKSGMLSGYPKAINALVALHNELPEELRDKKPLRDLSTSTEALTQAGQEYFESTYGDTSASVQGLLDGAFPDLGYFSRTMAYGYVYSFSDVLSHVDTSFAMISALIASDTPLQIGWHLRGAIRNGASEAEVRAVRQIAIEVSSAADVPRKHAIPDLEL